MSLGRNTVSGQELSGYVERVERLRDQKKALAADEKQVFAELHAKGFSPKRVREILKIRTMKPHDRQEAEQELDIYLHAMGMAAEAPLFRAVGAMGVDLAVREQVIEAFKQLVPPNGEIIVKVGGHPVRIWREGEEGGDVHAEDYREPTAAAPNGNGAAAGGSPMPSRPLAEIPDVDDAGASALGKKAYVENKPITANPFPFGDKRRPRWDEAWREASGSDGMGED
jgi:uncharacterized protein (UPF0335 family)